MSIILALLQFILVSGILVLEVKRKSPAMFLWATLFLMFGMMHLLDVIMGTGKYKSETMDHASLFVIVFCLFYLITRELIGRGNGKRIKQTFYSLSTGGFGEGYDNNNRILMLVFAIASLALCWDIIKNSGGLLNTSWGGAREIALEKSYFSSMQVFFIVFNALGGLLCVSIIKKNKMGIIITSALLVFVQIITRNRVLILPLLISVIVVFVFRMKKIRMRSIPLGIIGAVAVVYIVYAIRAFRWLGTLEHALSTFSFEALNNQIKYFLTSSDGELGLRQWMYYFIDHNNNFAAFGEGHTYLRMLLVYIPTRYSFGLKPDDFAIAMGSAIGMMEGGSMHPTLFGDCFANWGNIGVIFGAFWAALMTLFDKIILLFKKDDYKILTYILIATGCVIMGRGAVYNGFVDIAWGIPILGVFAFMDKVKVPSIKLRAVRFRVYVKRKV